MSYKIIMSKQQLQIIQGAINTTLECGETDEYGDNVLEVLRNLTQMTLECEEDDSTHGWII